MNKDLKLLLLEEAQKDEFEKIVEALGIAEPEWIATDIYGGTLNTLRPVRLPEGGVIEITVACPTCEVRLLQAVLTKAQVELLIGQEDPFAIGECAEDVLKEITGELDADERHLVAMCAQPEAKQAEDGDR